MQRLEFRCSISGDLTGLIAQYLDAHLGLKQASASCAAIVRDPKVEPGEALLPSDVTAELNHG
jgi:methionine salvage enolase-phosphatase E1